MKGLEPGATATAGTAAGRTQQAAAAGRGPRHAILRSATAAAHASLDSFTMEAGFFDCPARFVSYLRRMRRFHLAYAHAAHASDEFGWHGRWHFDRHLDWLAEDLQRVPSSAAVAQQLQSCRDAGADAVVRTLSALTPQCTSRLLGSLYVLAGSALGARMLHKITVARALPTDAGSTYLSRLSQSMDWQQFLGFLEAAAIDSEERMVEGALVTFSGVQRSLELAI